MSLKFTIGPADHSPVAPPSSLRTLHRDSNFEAYKRSQQAAAQEVRAPPRPPPPVCRLCVPGREREMTAPISASAAGGTPEGRVGEEEA